MAFAFNILSASLKSRLLRFALSRIDFLDDDALDLDQLDLTWGKKNVLALRDVGFNAAKLTSLLALPPCFVLTRALVRDLRITILADFTTGICVEVDGVTNFLNGVRDKLQVTFKSVELQLEMEIPPDGWDDDDTISPATVVFHVGRVDLEGLTLRSASVDTENNVDSTEDGRGNKRKLTLENLCAGLLLDERVMSKSRITTSSPESPATARYAPPEFGENSSQESSIHRSVSAPNPQSVEVSNASTIDDPLQHSKRNKMTESAFTTDDEKFADADEESASRGGSQMEESTVFGLGLSQLTDEDESLQQRDHGLSSSDVNFYDDQEHHLQVNRESSPEHMSFSGQVPQDASFASQYLSDELPGLNEPARSTCSVGSQSPPAEDYDETRDAADSRKSSRGSSPVSPKPQEKSSPTIAGPSAVDDLEQSRLFTHEDTESLYMSAMGGELDESDREFRMPGG